MNFLNYSISVLKSILFRQLGAFEGITIFSGATNSGKSMLMNEFIIEVLKKSKTNTQL